MASNDTDKTASFVAEFDIEDPEFPQAIDDATMSSGDYPYEKRMKRADYERELRLLQIELVKLQNWVREQNERIVMVFEGRDAAGKGGTIKRFMQHLNPRYAHIAALAKPNESERGQWYFQRYVARLPTSGDMVLFDRSWYNRSGVERVMGFSTDEQIERFLAEAPDFESQLVRDGIRLYKFWLTIGQEMQLKRFHDRRHDPLKRWKLSPIDIASLDKWDDYTRAKEDMFQHTHTTTAPWTVLRANDKRRLRVNAIRHVLSSIDYAEKDATVASAPDPNIVGSGPDYFYAA